MKLTAQFAGSPAERMDVEKLGWIVNEAVMSVSSQTGLAESEALDILEKIRIEMMGELQSAIQALEDRGAIPHIDVRMLSAAVENAIKRIAAATDLDTDEITEVFTSEHGASFDHLVCRLHAKSRIERFDHA